MIAWIVLGLVNGLLLALLTIGLVLVYKAGRFVNFAHAQLGVVSAMLLGKLVLDFHWNWWLAFPLSLGLGSLVGVCSELLLIRRLFNRNRVSMLIATIGLSQVLLALSYYEWLGPTRAKLHFSGYPVPFEVSVKVGSLTLGGQHFLIIGLVPALAVGLALLIQRTILGKSIRAAASNPDAARLAGISVRRVSTVTWGIAGGLSAVSAILAAPSQSAFDSQALGPSLLLRALGAAAFAGFTSLPWAFAAGVALGVVEAITLFITHNAGTAEFVMLLVILAGLFVRARAVKLGARDTSDRLDVHQGPITIPSQIAGRFLVRNQRRLLIGAGLLIGVTAPLMPWFSPAGKQFILSLTLIYALVALSLVLLTGWGGQVSLGQFALLGVGAFFGARMFLEGWSFGGALLVAGAIGAVISMIVGLPALRLSGLTLAVTTLGFAVAAPAWLFRQSWFAPPGTTTVPAPGLAGTGALQGQRSIYYAGLVVLTLACLALATLRRSGAGRLLIATRDNPVGASAFGISATWVRLAVFAISGFMAATAGVLWLGAWRSVSVELFRPQQSLVMLSLPVIGGIASIPGAILGSVLVFAIPALTADFVKSVFSITLQFQLFAGGLGLIAIQLRYPAGVAGFIRDRWEVLLNRIAARTAAPSPSLEQPPPPSREAPAPPPRHTPLHDGEPLQTSGLKVTFGGIVAVDDASIVVRPGEVVGLIGSNGAGKTTMLDSISGIVTASAGSILVFGHEIQHLAPERRAMFGIARSFQDGRLFPGLTVRETIQFALYRQNSVGFVPSLLGLPWTRFAERHTEDLADALIHRLGLEAWCNTQTINLSTGTRRICDLAAQMAVQPELLLLDEPTSGIAQREAEAFGPLLRRTVDELGCACLIIEHDMPLLLGLADRIYCLESGQIIAEGTPAQIRRNPAVIASYLGTSAVQRRRSSLADRRRKTSQRGSPERTQAKLTTGVRSTTGSRKPRSRPSKGRER